MPMNSLAVYSARRVTISPLYSYHPRLCKSRPLSKACRPFPVSEILPWIPPKISSHSLQTTNRKYLIYPFPSSEVQSPSSTIISRNVKIHLCSLSELANHPLARRPLLEFSVEPDVNWGNFMSSVYIQLADDALSVYIWVGRAGTRLITWNWHTGDIIFVRPLIPPHSHLIYLQDLRKDSLPRLNNDFSLISPRAFIITSLTWPGSIYVYTFRTGKPEMVAILSLPELLNPHVNVHQVNTHCGPICGRELPGQPLSAALEYNIHILRAKYSSFEGDMKTYSIYIRNKTFLSFIKNHTLGKGGEALKRPIPWNDWSKGQTRFMLTPAPYNWLRFAISSLCNQILTHFH